MKITVELNETELKVIEFALFYIWNERKDYLNSTQTFELRELQRKFIIKQELQAIQTEIKGA